MPCKIIFAQGPKKWEYEDEVEAIELLIRTYENVLNASIENKFGSILLPALGTGDYGFTHEETSNKVIAVLKRFVRNHDIDVYFVVYDKSAKGIYDYSLMRK